MAEFSKLVTTKKGHELINKLLAGEITGVVDFPYIAVSSTKYQLSELEDLETLTNIHQRSLVSNKEITSIAAMKVETSFTNENLTAGYYIRAVGLYATVGGENEILFGVAIETSDKDCWMPPFNGMTVSGAYITLVTEISNAEHVTLEVNPAAIATVGNIQAIQKLLDAHKAQTATDSDGVHGLRVNSGVLQYQKEDGTWENIAGGGSPHECEYVSESTVEKIVDGSFVPGTDPEEQDTATQEDIDGIVDGLFNN